MRRVLLPALAALLLAPASLSALPPDQETEHVVGEGETLNGIANRAKVSREVIIKANGLKDPFVVRIGQKLKIPRQAKSEGKAAQLVIPAKPQGASLADASSYVVQTGDSLGSIAIRAQIPRVLIAEANGLSSQDTIRTGQKLVLPRTRRHTVAAGETGFAIAYKYAVPWEQIAIANGIEANAPLPPGKVLLIPTIVAQPKAVAAAQTPTPAPAATTPPAATKPAASQPAATARFAWPLVGPIRRGFTPRSAGEYHDGIDITARRGEAVRAVAAGKVVFAKKDPDQFGNLVVVEHGDGWHSAYGSLDRITVKEGDPVKATERVGTVGDTSLTRKTELHFELRKAGKPVDPVDYLPARP
jgi:murein DD-endopeptidase MepM/ murein hydrolase activator NlpD